MPSGFTSGRCIVIVMQIELKKIQSMRKSLIERHTEYCFGLNGQVKVDKIHNSWASKMVGKIQMLTDLIGDGEYFYEKNPHLKN